MSELRREVEDTVNQLMGEVSEDIDLVDNAVSSISQSRNTWSHEDPELQHKALDELEQWYSKAYPLVSEYSPERKEEFRERYNRLTKAIEVDIHYIRENDISGLGTLKTTAQNSLSYLIRVIKAIPNRVEAEELKAKENVSSYMVSEEIQRAKQLFDEDHIRAAGVIGGVALERHLTTLCETSEQDLEFGYMDGISSLATTLSDANEIGDDDQRLLEYLGGIRNKCGHASEEEPEKREVERMLNQTDEFIR